jgi:hypothetical protein
MITSDCKANFVYVDPGHATLIHAVRQHHHTVTKLIIPVGPHTKRRRALYKYNVMAEKNLCSYQSAMATRYAG